VKVLGVTKITDLPWLNLFQVAFEGKDGSPGTWTVCSRKKELLPGSYPVNADAVHIIPLLKDGRKRKLVTIKEFRIPLGVPEYGFPAGLYNPNEDLKSVVKRELMEETGLKLTKILYASPACVTSAGMSDESNTYVVCECTGTVDTSGTGRDRGRYSDIDQLSALRKNNNNNISAKALPFMLLFESLKKIAWPRHMRQ
jgi:ADP-ribose pyrophosphatase